MSAARIEARSVKAAAAGNWLAILQSLSADLSPAITAKGRHVECPVHGGQNGDAFRMFPDANQKGGGICNSCGAFADGFALLMWVQGWTFPQALEQVASVLGMVDAAPAYRTTPIQTHEVQPVNTEYRRAALQAVWRESTPMNWAIDTPVMRYLEGRGLGAIATDPPQYIRQNERLPYWSKSESCSYHNAMIAPVLSPDGEVVSLHRSYLTHHGRKAAVCSPKKLMPAVERGATTGGAIRLYEADSVLCVTEGIETSLAVRLALGLPVWATVSAGGMECLDVPSCVREVHIYADNDVSGRGQQAANRLADRMRGTGRNASIVIPPMEGMDWLDVMNSKEVAA